MHFNSCEHEGKELILRILFSIIFQSWYCEYFRTRYNLLIIQLPTFVCSPITANSNDHLILCRRKMFRLSTRAGETLVFSCKWSHKSVTEIIKEILSPVLCGTNRSFKRQFKKKHVSLMTGVQIKVSEMCRLQYTVVSIFSARESFV